MTTRPTVLVVLQNAWRTNGKKYSHKEWVAALWKSHTGRRLKNILPKTPHDLYIINASPRVGTKSSAAFPADIGHIEKRIAQIEPDIIVACGQTAANAITAISPNALCIIAPHPAWRAYSKEREAQIYERVEDATERAYRRLNRYAA